MVIVMTKEKSHVGSQTRRGPGSHFEGKEDGPAPLTSFYVRSFPSEGAEGAQHSPTHEHITSNINILFD